MPRFQFSLRDVLWLVLVVAAFFGGMRLQLRIGEPFIIVTKGGGAWSRREGGMTRSGSWKKVTLADGTEWLNPKGDMPTERHWRHMMGEKPSIAELEAELAE